MPKTKRLQYPGAFYHVINRGRNREKIFHNKSDFEYFLELISKCNKKFQLSVHAYCLMDNHFHLLLETPLGNLDKIMHYISSLYVKKFNREKGYDGSLFRARYKAILIDKDSYLLELNRYIHRNPFSLVRKIENYKWSSLSSYLNLSKTPHWLNKKFTMDILSSKNDIDCFLDFIGSKKEKKEELYGNQKVLPSILGDKKFINLSIKKSNKFKIKESKLNKIWLKT